MTWARALQEGGIHDVDRVSKYRSWCVLWGPGLWVLIMRWCTLVRAVPTPCAVPAASPRRLHLPVGYHGRASSVVVSGTDVYRPWGQIPGATGEAPRWAPSAVVDYELELVWHSGGGERGERGIE